MTMPLTTRQQIVAEAATWLRTPYHHEAMVKGAGVDCAQILIAVYSAVGLAEKPDIGHYPPDWMLHRSDERYLGWIEKYCDIVEKPQPGDIAVFKFGRCFSHAGIVTFPGWPAMIHAHRPSGCVCETDGTKGDLDGREVRFYSIRSLP